MARTWTVKKKLALLALFCVAVGFGAICLWALRGDRINEANYEQIRLGMMVEDVQVILGRPGIDFNDTWPPGRQCLDTKVEGRFEEKPDDSEPGKRLCWLGQDTFLVVRIGEGGRVTDRMFMTLNPLTFLERLRGFAAW